MRRKGSVLNDLTLQIMETTLTKLSSASTGLCLLLEITNITHDQNDCVCWRKSINNVKEKQWHLCLTYSAKSSLHLLKTGWFSFMQENKANVVNKVSETETDFWPWQILRYCLTREKQITLNWYKVRIHVKKNLWINKIIVIKKSMMTQVWVGLDLKTYKARHQSTFKSAMQWHHLVYA